MIGKYHAAVILYLHSPGVLIVLQVCVCVRVFMAACLCVHVSMCKTSSFFCSSVQQGLEAIASGNPTVMREGISSSPHSSPLVRSLSLSGEMESAAY